MTDEQIERLAQAIHDHYCTTMKALGSPTSSDLANRSWSELGPADQQANRAQARSINEKLDRFDFVAVTEDDSDAVSLEWTPAQIETLAEAEHARWMHQKMQAGWRPGTERDLDDKIHELLVPYNDLTSEQRELDRAPVRHIPELLRIAGMKVRRTSTT